MRHKLIAAAACLTLVGSASAHADSPAASPNRPPADPNQKICQDITMVGSRLATKRICATRAQWEAQKRDSKDDVERMQREIKLQCQAPGTITGSPSC